MKCSRKITAGFLFQEVEDLASVKDDDAVCILSRPRPFAATKSLAGIFKFEENLEYSGL